MSITPESSSLRSESSILDNKSFSLPLPHNTSEPSANSAANRSARTPSPPQQPIPIEKAGSFALPSDLDRRVSTWSFTPRGEKHSVCVAVDQSGISKIAFESILSFVPKKLHLFRCVLPGESAPQNKKGVAEAVYGEIANRHQFFAPLTEDHALVKSKEDIPNAIIKYAARQKCELIALGTRRREEKKPGGHSLGHIVDRVVRESHIPVYIIRTSLIQKPSQRYVIAIDGSKITDFCIDCIRDLARPSDEIVVMCCQTSVKEAEGALLIHMRRLLPAPWPEAKIISKAFARDAEMSIGDNICAIADQLDADTLVLATGWKRTAYDLGSVTSSCIYQAKLKCNVFIYKNPRLLDVPGSSRRIGSVASTP